MPLAAYNMPEQHVVSFTMWWVLSTRILFSVPCPVLSTVYTVPPHAVHVQTVIDMVLPSRSLTANSVPCTITQQYQLPTSRCLSRLSQIWLRMPWACQPVGHSHHQTQNHPHKVLSPIQVTSLCLSCISHLFTSLALCVHWRSHFSHSYQTQNHPNTTMLVFCLTQVQNGSHFLHLLHRLHYSSFSQMFHIHTFCIFFLLIFYLI